MLTETFDQCHRIGRGFPASKLVESFSDTAVQPSPLALVPVMSTVHQLILPIGIEYRILPDKVVRECPADAHDAVRLLNTFGLTNF